MFLCGKKMACTKEMATLTIFNIYIKPKTAILVAH